VITVRVDPDRLSRSRFVVSRLVELTNGLEVLAHPERAPFAHGWVHRTRGRLDHHRVAVLFALAEQATWYVPDFLVPIPADYEPGLADELDRVAATPADVVREQLTLAFQIGPPPAALLACRGTGADPRPPLPVEVRAVVDGGGHEALAQRVAVELETLWQVALADTWPMVARVLDQDVRHRAAMASRRGFGDILADLHPDIGWDGRSLTVRKTADRTLDPRPGVLLAPSVFLSKPAVWLGAPGQVMLGAPGQVMLGYVARGRGRVWSGAVSGVDHSRVLGPRRTALLTDLQTARSTTELAGRHTLSPATISYHLSRLHDAGLVSRRQAGHEVLYEQTDLASRLLTALAP
jgi:DNA-binding transcriptional ArsR family regulator